MDLRSPSSPWQRVIDPRSGQPYYWNTQTNQTQYEAPLDSPLGRSAPYSQPDARQQQGYSPSPVHHLQSRRPADLGSESVGRTPGAGPPDASGKGKGGAMQRKRPRLWTPAGRPAAPTWGQHLLVMIGPPGSGKSTIAQRFLEQGGVDWARINQDELGDVQACEFEAERAFRAGKSVIIDRCNFDAAQRRRWVRVAQAACAGALRVWALGLWVPKDECIRRVRARPYHPTLHPSNAAQVVEKFFGMMEQPTEREGYHAIHYASCDQDVYDLMQEIAAFNWESAIGASPTHPPAHPTQPAAYPHPAHNTPGSPAQPPPGARLPGPSPSTSSPALHNRTAAACTPPPFNPAGAQLPQGTPSTGGFDTPGPASQHRERGRHRHRHRGGGGGAGGGGEGPHELGAPLPPHLLAATGMPVGEDGRIATAAAGDRRPFLLFDLNGTLTAHTSVRYSSGKHELRPHVDQMVHLAGKFRLAIFSSATVRTVETARALIEEACRAAHGPAAVPPAGLFQFALDRRHCAPLASRGPRGKSWDTCKPLERLFSSLGAVVLLDDDEFKSLEGERANLVRVPCWDGSPDDRVLPRLVELLLQGPAEATDVREHTGAITRELAQMQPSLPAHEEQTNGVGAVQSGPPVHTNLDTADDHGEIAMDDNPDEIAIDDNPEEIAIDDNPEEIAIDDNPEEIAIDDNPEEIAIDDNPEEIAIDDNPEEIAIDDNPEEIAIGLED